MPETGNNITSEQSNTTLSIRVSSGGFCFYIGEGSERSKKSFGSSATNFKKTPTELLVDALEEMNLLNHPGMDVEVVFESPELLFVPNPLKDGVACYKDVLTPRLAAGRNYIASEGTLKEYTLFYFADMNILGFLKRTFSNLRISHLIEPLLADVYSSKAKRYHAVYSRNQLFIVSGSNARIGMASAFRCNTESDVAYFILAAGKQMGVDFNSDIIHISTDKQSGELIDTLSKVCRNINHTLIKE